MLFFEKSEIGNQEISPELTHAYHMDETDSVKVLLDYLQFTPEMEKEITDLAAKLVVKVREIEAEKSAIEALLQHYDLSSEEGILLMCLAEALQRVPDKQTEKLLIQDKLTSADWQKHLHASESAFVNSMTWVLALTGKVLEEPEKAGYIHTVWHRLIRRTGEPLIRQAIRRAITVLSEQFVLGETIEEAFKHGQKLKKAGYLFSYDMLGEAAHTAEDAHKYFVAYQHAIAAISQQKSNSDNIFLAPSISVKLSALHPRYEFSQIESVIPELTTRLKLLVINAKNNNIGLTIDTEEADRLELTLHILKAIFLDPELDGWEGLGIAVQAYQKRALPLIKWLIDLARDKGRRMQIRLVKGAYWDTEIKQAQMLGYEEYPVFTRKSSTDLCYLACAKLLFSSLDAVYPQFATHNAYTVAAVVLMAKNHQSAQFEFQHLQGMGKSLHQQIIAKEGLGIPSRIYAPVGKHEDLLPYLLRRLIENGANSSFVHQIANVDIPISELIRGPIEITQSCEQIPNPLIPLPRAIYGEQRINSTGLDFSYFNERENLALAMENALTQKWIASPFNRDFANKMILHVVRDPSDSRREVGRVLRATKQDVLQALDKAEKAFFGWDELGVEARANILEKTADLLEQHRAELMAMTVREGGKTLPDSSAEVREAVDFCRYYALQARQIMANVELKGYTGESDTLRLHPHGVILCISPWNFPIAIFTGQIAAALVTGNCVIAKPAEQTSLVAAKIVELFYQAGIPKEVLQLLPGQGATIGNMLVENERIKGVIFTGSTATAKIIQRSLAARLGPIVPLIAETGGVNAMIADSTVLPEQLIRDVLISAFNSAGQRCSALRVLFLQEEIADKVLTLLKGAMAELKIGDPMLLATDVGPVIDKEAQHMLLKHARKMEREARLIYRVDLPAHLKHGTFVAPHAFELPDLSLLRHEVFGPMLHVIRYKRADLDKVIDDINQLGYGLTFGIHSRINSTIEHIQRRIKAGNIYVNRNMIGAVVGLQPFGGSELSGTGPKAGGPNYLVRLCRESTLTIDTTAMGGNASLMGVD